MKQIDIHFGRRHFGRRHFGRRHFGRRLLVWGLVLILSLACAPWQSRSLGDDVAIAQAKSLSQAFRAAAKKVMPTVVQIKTSVKPQKIAATRENPFEGTPFEDFYDEEDFRRFHAIPRREALGSGVIIDAAGIVLTNNHVVEGADEVIVELSDGRRFKATDIKTDDKTDLAVLRIDAREGLSAAVLGDSDAMEIGDWVLAIGNPFGLESTVSAGIISGKGRSWGMGKRTDFLQTDAAINMGNSGGPLVNLDGEVVGINTAIVSPGIGGGQHMGFQGIGFAIPSNLARWVKDQLVTRGSVQRAYLGIQIREIDAPLARQFGVQPNRGVLVNEVYPDTPAAAAGLRVGDVVLDFAGRPVNSPRELQEQVERSKIGARQPLDIIRNGKPGTLEVAVETLPADFGAVSIPAIRRAPPGNPSVSDSAGLGLEVTDLTDALAERLGLQGLAGVVATEVDAEGVAAQAGIRAGMLILRVGAKDVKSIADFKAAMKHQSLKRGVLLLVRGSGGNRFLVLQR